jgi:hypothetical protein
MIANNESKGASTLVRETKTSIIIKSGMQKKKKSFSLWEFRSPVRMMATRKRVGSATDKDSLTNNFQWANWDTSEESKQREESPWVPQTRTVHTFATEEIVFWVGPRKDGIVKTNTTPPFILTTNYYQLLIADETHDYPPVPVHFYPTSN